MGVGENLVDVEVVIKSGMATPSLLEHMAVGAVDERHRIVFLSHAGDTERKMRNEDFAVIGLKGFPVRETADGNLAVLGFLERE